MADLQPSGCRGVLGLRSSELHTAADLVLVVTEGLPVPTMAVMVD